MSAAALVRQRVSALGSSLSLATASEPITEDQEFCQVEALQEQGEVAAKNGRHKDAVKIFAEALEIDATQFQIRAFKVCETSAHCLLTIPEVRSNLRQHRTPYPISLSHYLN